MKKKMKMKTSATWKIMMKSYMITTLFNLKKLQDLVEKLKLHQIVLEIIVYYRHITTVEQYFTF